MDNRAGEKNVRPENVSMWVTESAVLWVRDLRKREDNVGVRVRVLVLISWPVCFTVGEVWPGGHHCLSLIGSRDVSRRMGLTLSSGPTLF